MSDDSFLLYDILVEVLNDGLKPMICNHKEGDSFMLSGENFTLPDKQSFPIYCLAALIPIITVKQRQTDLNDWMTQESIVACPDPFCGGLFKISRLRQRRFNLHRISGIKEEKKNA